MYVVVEKLHFVRLGSLFWAALCKKLQKYLISFYQEA